MGASLEVMERDARRMRNGQPFIFTNLMTQHNLDAVIAWIRRYGLLESIVEPDGVLR